MRVRHRPRRHRPLRPLGIAALAALALGCYEARRREPDVGPVDAPFGSCGTCATVVSCTPGRSIVVGCDGTVGARCTGDPTLTICDAAVVADPEACDRSGPGFLAFDDDGGEGLCSLAMLTCPRSGRIAIDPNPFSSAGSTWSCPYAVLAR